MRKGKQRKSQSRTGRARPVAFLWPKYMVFEILYYTCHPWHIGIAESPVWKTIDCASWLLGGWRWRAGKWHLQRRCQDPESWARAAAPPSSIQHQTELTSQPGAPQPLCRKLCSSDYFFLFFCFILLFTCPQILPSTCITDLSTWSLLAPADSHKPLHPSRQTPD